ncbi:MAG: phosphoadenosine phosphosulfate reductase family protein [Patescibacteria group bacterium]|jgi:phosphoadenosine phosphosulfate reductase
MQLTFENKTIDQLAIELIQAYEPPEGYYLGFSGGKDSVVIYDLTNRSGVKFQAYYNVSPIDPPQIRDFIKANYPEVIWENHAKNFWNVHVMRNGLPMRNARWCCRIIKECGGEGRTKILGMRGAESDKRKGYKCFQEQHGNGGGYWLLPIHKWQDSDVWQYIYERKLEVCQLYSEGFTRIGCVLCPYAGKDEIKLSVSKFPKIVRLWQLACDNYIQKRIERGTPITQKTGEELFNWWIKR